MAFPYDNKYSEHQWTMDKCWNVFVLYEREDVEDDVEFHRLRQIVSLNYDASHELQKYGLIRPLLASTRLQNGFGLDTRKQKIKFNQLSVIWIVYTIPAWKNEMRVHISH
jgi:hypothetical protein